jgi:hypothetical protein
MQTLAHMLFVFATLVLTILCVYVAGRMASQKGRSPRAWMWSAAFFGPLPLLALGLLPPKRHPA